MTHPFCATLHRVLRSRSALLLFAMTAACSGSSTPEPEEATPPTPPPTTQGEHGALPPLAEGERPPNDHFAHPTGDHGGNAFQLPMRPDDNSSPIAKRAPHSLTPLSPEADQWASVEEYRRWLGEHLDAGHTPMDFFSSAALDIDLATLGIEKGDVLADVGCGTGSLELLMLDQKLPISKIYGVDIDETSLDFFRVALEATKLDLEGRVELVHSSLEDVMLPADSVDVLVSVNTRLIPPPEALEPPRGDGIRKLFASIHSAMKPDATFHMIEPANEMAPGQDEGAHSPKEFTTEYMTEVMAGFGFETISVESVLLGDQKEPNHHLVFGLSTGQ